MIIRRPVVSLALLFAVVLLAFAAPALADTQCKPAAPLAQSKCTKDAQCCPGLVCEASHCQAGCRIGGVAYSSGAVNPANPCQSCQPAVSTVAWTNRGNGASCDDGVFCNGADSCRAGVCTHAGNPCPGPNGDANCSQSCSETSKSCTAPDPVGSACSDGNSCSTGETCQADATCGGATIEPDRTACDNGGVCCGGACAGSCPAPRVVATSIQEGDVAAVGNLTYTVSFSRPMLTGNLDDSDVLLSGNLLGISYTPASMSYDATGTVLTVNYTGLPDDSYTLTLLSGDGRFEGVSGFDLDGEPVAFPIPPNQSGDGADGGNFYVDFVLDAATTALSPLTPEAPLGSLVYDPTQNGAIAPAGDTDSYTLNLDAGQTLSVLLAPNSKSLQPAVEVRDPSANLIGSATAVAAGNTAILQTVPISQAGTYTITVSGANGTTGGYKLRSILNAAVENEEFGGAGDDTLATAQDLSAAFIRLAGTASRAAVLGANDANQGATWYDTYSFTVHAGDTAFLGLTVLSGSGGSVTLQDGSSQVLATSASGIISGYVFSAGGTYYVQVSGTESLAYDLLVGRNLVFDTEPNDSLATAQTFGSAPAALGAVTSTDQDWYSFTGAGGQLASIRTLTPADGPGEFVNTLDPKIELYDPNGNLVASGSAAADGRNEQITFTLPAPGTYYVRVTAEGGTSGEYVLDRSAAGN